MFLCKKSLKKKLKISTLDARRVELYQWADPVLGPRKIPALDKPMEGLVPVPQDAVFTIDMAAKTVECGGEVCPALVYHVTISS